MNQRNSVHKRVLSALYLSTLLLFLCGLYACSPKDSVDKESPHPSQEAFELFLKEEFCSSFENELINLHYTLKNPEAFGIHKPEKATSDLSLESTDQIKKELSQTKERLLEIPKSKLTKDQQRIYKTLERYLEQQIALCDYPQFLNPLSYATGLSSNLPLTLAEYTFYTEEDVKDYLSILPQIPYILNQAFTLEKEQTGKGCGMAAFEIEDTMEQIDTFLDDSKTNLLIDTFESRIQSLEGLSEDQKQTYLNNNLNLVNHVIIPAFKDLKEDLKDLKKEAAEGKGLYYHEDGLAYYELLLASMTLSDRSASTMINSLEKRFEELNNRITKVILENPGLYEIFSSTIETTPSDGPSPEEMLSTLKDAVQTDYPALSDVTYKVEPIPDPLKNDTTAAYYLIPPYDSPEENRIYYGDSTSDPASLFMTLAHEGYPGHLYHQNYLLQHGLSPIFYVLDMTGYKEGWAFYVQIDTADYCNFGKYDETYHEGLTELYRCNLEYSYCLSSLIDLYVNAEGNTREDIREYVLSLGMDQDTADSLYDFSIEEPGTYLQYYIGYLEILSIRQNAEKKMGTKFNELDFHTAFLEQGPCYYEDLAKYLKGKY